MRPKYPVRVLAILGVILLTLSCISFPSSVAEITTYSEDGVWINTLSNESTIDFDSDKLIISDGVLQFNKTESGISYDYNDSNNHEAFGYQLNYLQFVLMKLLPIPSLTSPDRLLENKEEFSKFYDYPRIRFDDDKFAETPTDGLKNYAVQHFRFKLNTDYESIGNLDILWKGEAQNDEKILMLVYKYWPMADRQLGSWHQIDETSENMMIGQLKDDESLDASKDHVSDDNYLDVIIVAYSSLLGSCKLSTDYIKVVSESEEGYITGTSIATTHDSINPKEISDTSEFYWDTLSWEDSEKSDSKVKYQILRKGDVATKWIPVEDEYLPGNSEGFTEPPVNLNSINSDLYDKLKIRMNLTSDNPKYTPKVFDLTLTWQNDLNKWQDSFESSVRIGTKNKIKVNDGQVIINPVSGDWPTFGQNARNIRASDGKGPGSNELKWYAELSEQTSVVSPVVSGEFLYTLQKDSKNLFKYDITSEPNPDFFTIEYLESVELGKVLYSSPTIYGDYLIISTGATSSSGTSNYVYCFETDNLDNYKWRFKYNSDTCYWSNPVVENDIVYLSTWNGDIQAGDGNNNYKLFAIEIDQGQGYGNNINNDALLWEQNLPADSFSTPAVYNDVVYVGCQEDSENSLFAFDANTGANIWNKSIGSIGFASPVIYEENLFIVTRKASGLAATAEVLAIDTVDGGSLWNKTISRSLSTLRYTKSDNTPSIYNGILYVSSPDGTIYALDVLDGTEKWSTSLYDVIDLQGDIAGELLTSSTAYADGKVYVGTPEGKFYALDADDGTTIWSFNVASSSETVTTSAVVTNGFAFFGDENGILYAIGDYVEPDKEIEGYMISVPINLPQKKWWNKFYAHYNVTEGENSINFSILDEDGEFISNIQNKTNISLNDIDQDKKRTIRLRADFYANNSSVNPELFKWYVTFKADNNAPDFVENSFTPNPEGWSNDPTPLCSIDVWDNGTGLDMSSAEYKFKYKEKDGDDTKEKTGKLNYTGEDGNNFSYLSVDISQLEISSEIDTLIEIWFNITDLADNTATFHKAFKQDTIKPTSTISNDTNGSEFKVEQVKINVTAQDPGVEDVNSSGIASIKLFYRHSISTSFSGSWKSFGETAINVTEYTWNFTAEEGGGYYELMTLATDVAGNNESDKDEGEVKFIMDSFAPDNPDYDDEIYWFNERPEFSFDFEDDFRLDKIEYRPSFETIWTVIDDNIDERVFSDNWELSEEFWNEMQEGNTYYVYFRITDSLGNQLLIENTGDSLKLSKDDSTPNVNINAPGLDVEWTWEDKFEIEAFVDEIGSGLKSVELYYRYSKDNDDWSEWEKYGETLTSTPFKWDFVAEEGNGYYEFKIIAEDAAGNVAESEVFSTGINLLPIVLIAGFVALIIALLVISVIIILKIRVKKK